MTTRLWWVRPENIQACAAALALLDAEERQQQQRFIPPAKRQEYLATRVLIRSVLGDMLDMAPQALAFVRNEFGRPVLAPGLMSTPLHFNLSHTEGLVVCLVSTTNEVGVDTELFSRGPKLLALAPDVFASREQDDLAALPSTEQAARAVMLWTLKESYIKGRGMGLAIPLDGFAFRFDQGSIGLDVEPALNDDGRRWQFQSTRLGAHCISTAIATANDQSQSSMEAVTVDYAEFCRFPE